MTIGKHNGTERGVRETVEEVVAALADLKPAPCVPSMARRRSIPPVSVNQRDPKVNPKVNQQVQCLLGQGDAT